MNFHPPLSRAFIIAAVMLGYFAAGYFASQLVRFEAPSRPAVTAHSSATVIAPWPLIALPALQALLTP